MAKNDYIRSPLNYTGGKYKLLPQLIPLFPKDVETFVDLFAGGCNVVVNATAKRYIANDIEHHVIGIYNWFKSCEIDVIINDIEGIVQQYSLSKYNTDGYKKLRDDYNSLLTSDIVSTPFYSTLLFFVLICYCFNHQFRFNKDGGFNMPFGYNVCEWNDSIKKNLINFQRAIREKDIIFTNKSFDELKVEKLGRGDLIYCDPPYLITCAMYNENRLFSWTPEMEKELYRMLDRANENGVRFALSNVLESKGKYNDLLAEWAARYNIIHLDFGYSNSSYHTKSRAKKSDEVLITNY